MDDQTKFPGGAAGPSSGLTRRRVLAAGASGAALLASPAILRAQEEKR